MKTMRLESLRRAQNWFDDLDTEDFTFIKRFILASGSLKELAAAYEVSYPTVRLRLDRLIQKIRILDKFESASEFERQLRAALADQRIDAATFKKLLTAYKADQEAHHAKLDNSD